MDAERRMTPRIEARMNVDTYIHAKRKTENKKNQSIKRKYYLCHSPTP